MHRFIPNSGEGKESILKALNISSVDELFLDIPESQRFQGDLPINKTQSELEVLSTMEEFARENTPQSAFSNFIGAGVYDHFRPLIIDHIISRSEFYTAYTPYQPEISQGTLQAIFEYQSLICDLTGMDASNASMYDGTNAAVEAVLLGINNDKKPTNVLISEGVHPQTIEVIKTYLHFRNVEINMIPLKDGKTDLEELKRGLEGSPSGFLFQNPNFFGGMESVAEIAGSCKEQKVLSMEIVDPISLGILKAPGSQGIDIVVGDGQALGNGMNFGGPYLGFMAVTNKLLRKIPGRLVGLSKDTKGQRAFVLTLQAREQHIRRYKATSNICSNQSLNALSASIYLVTMGKAGLREVCEQSHAKAMYLKNGLLATGKFKEAFPGPAFKEFALRYDGDLVALLSKLRQKNILGGYQINNDTLLIAVTEKRSKEELDQYIAAVKEA